MLNVIGIIVSVVLSILALMLFISLLKFIILGAVIGLITSLIFGSFWWGFIPCVVIGFFSLGKDGEFSGSGGSSASTSSRSHSCSNSGLSKDSREFYETMLNEREWSRSEYYACLKSGEEYEERGRRYDSDDDFKKAEDAFREARNHLDNVERLDREIELFKMRNGL